MIIQSLSLCAPTQACKNDCSFCCAHMNPQDSKDLYPTVDYENKRWEREFFDRLSYVHENSCQDVIISGNGEPTDDMDFIRFFFEVNNQLPSSFKKVELQTNGTNLSSSTIKELVKLGIKTISLSISSFCSEENAAINKSNKKYTVDIPSVCKNVKDNGLNLRISLNMNKNVIPDDIKEDFDEHFQFIISNSTKFGASELTIRKLFKHPVLLECSQNRWIEENDIETICSEWYEKFNDKIKQQGILIRELPFGALLYNLEGLSIVIDSDCMAQVPKRELKYAILRPNFKLYSRWDVPALIF